MQKLGKAWSCHYSILDFCKQVYGGHENYPVRQQSKRHVIPLHRIIKSQKKFVIPLKGRGFSDTILLLSVAKSANTKNDTGTSIEWVLSLHDFFRRMT